MLTKALNHAWGDIKAIGRFMLRVARWYWGMSLRAFWFTAGAISTALAFVALTGLAVAGYDPTVGLVP